MGNPHAMKSLTLDAAIAELTSLYCEHHMLVLAAHSVLKDTERGLPPTLATLEKLRELVRQEVIK
jgi:hypothetical protein